MQHKSLKEENSTGILVALYRGACQYNIPAVPSVTDYASSAPWEESFTNIA